MIKLKPHNSDVLQEKISAIASIFPNCVAESIQNSGGGGGGFVVDFEQLRQELSGNIVEEDREKYVLTWPGKRQSLLSANAPTHCVIRPDFEGSRSFFETSNVLIKGDNLTALKVLQHAYARKIKMIYIDPPYNTGNDYIYQDNFHDNIQNYLLASDQINDDGDKELARTEKHGRFHSHWLSMMYPRLRLAHNLLRDDGVLFVSIDDNEVHNLRKILDEIFGERNFIANIIWEKKFSPSNDAHWLSDNHDHILLYARSKPIWRPNPLPREDKQNDRYKNPDNDPRGPWISGDLTVKSYSEPYDYPITTPSGKQITPPNGTCWRVSAERFEELVKDNRVWFGTKNNNVPRLKRFLSDVKEGVVPVTIWKHDDVGHNQGASQELRKLFDNKNYFGGPKPVSLIRRMIWISGAKEKDIILDFFAGSGTTGHAVMKSNAEDGEARRFILVQLDEKIDLNSNAGKAGFGTIADITVDRMRRAGIDVRKSNLEHAKSIDIGFRTFFVDSSNYNDINLTNEYLTSDNILRCIDNIKSDRKGEDLLIDIMLRWGISLEEVIAKEDLEGRQIWIVGNNELIACFDSGIGDDIIQTLARRRPLNIGFRDDCFVSDSSKINAYQTITQLSPSTRVLII